MQMTYLSIATALLLTLLAGCGCDQYGVFGLDIEVIDAETRAPVPAAEITVRDGAYVETFSGSRAAAASERPGTYSVTIRAPGYQAWQRDNIRVREEGVTCPHPDQVQLTARLEPLNLNP